MISIGVSLRFYFDLLPLCFPSFTFISTLIWPSNYLNFRFNSIWIQKLANHSETVEQYPIDIKTHLKCSKVRSNSGWIVHCSHTIKECLKEYNKWWWRLTVIRKSCMFALCFIISGGDFRATFYLIPKCKRKRDPWVFLFFSFSFCWVWFRICHVGGCSMLAMSRLYHPPCFQQSQMIGVWRPNARTANFITWWWKTDWLIRNCLYSIHPPHFNVGKVSTTLAYCTGEIWRRNQKMLPAASERLARSVIFQAESTELEGQY